MSKLAAAYLRRSVPEATSAERTGRDVHSLAIQEDWCRHAGGEDGYERVAVYKDEKSGKSLAGRDDLKRLIEDVARGKPIRCVYVYAVDRLSRDKDIMATIVEFLQCYDVDLVFGNLRDTVGSNADLLLTILAALAEMELKEITRKPLRRR